jgi:hypothetical protein
MQEWLKYRGEVALRFAQDSPPKLALWLGLAWVGLVGDHPFIFLYSSRHIKKKETTPDCPVTMLRGSGTKPLGRARFPAALSPATAPASNVSIHRGPPACQPRTQRVHNRSRPTGDLITTEQPSSKPQPTPLWKDK